MKRIFILALSTVAFLLTLSQVGQAADESAIEKNPVSLEGKAIPAQLYYAYPLLSFDGDFTRYNSYHNYYGVSIAQNLPETKHFGIRAWDAGFGDQTDRYLDLETGEIVYTSSVYGETPTTRILPPAMGGDLADYLQELRKIKWVIEFVATTGHGSGSEPAYPQLNQAAAYINAILLQLDPPAADVLDFNGLDGSKNIKLGQGESSKILATYRSAQERDLLVTLSVDAAVQSEQRIALPLGEGTTEVSYVLPASTPVGASAHLSLKLVPRDEPGSRATTEVTAPITVLAANRISEVVLSYDRLVPGDTFEVETWFKTNAPRDIRVDLFDETGTWLTGKQEAGEVHHAVFLEAPATLVPGKTYRISVKILPTGANWSEYLAQSEISVTASQP